MSNLQNFKVKALHYHRNGICGAPFYVVNFTYKEDGETFNMVATVFSENNNIAVLRLNDLAENNFDGTMRGDHFEDDCRAAIMKHEQEGGYGAEFSVNPKYRGKKVDTVTAS